MDKGSEKNSRAAVAGRLAYLREYKFQTEGFAPNTKEKDMKLSQAHSMHASNKRTMSGLKPTPSVSG